MSRRPESDPLGATPALPSPAGTSANGVAQVFRRWLTTQAAAAPEVDEAPAPSYVPAGRRDYSAAWSKVASLLAPPEAAAPDGGTDPAIDATPTWHDAEATGPTLEPLGAGEADEVTATQLVPVRPPPGAPTVRPPVHRAAAADVDRAALASLAESAMLVHDPDGATAFEIAFDDAVLRDVACRIAVRDGRVTAVFHAADATTRRLLEGESDRLRADLEARGLRVDAVTVDSQEP